MGLSSSKSTTTSGPSAQALPYLQSASSTLQNTYNANAANSSQIGQSLYDAYNSYANGLNNNSTTSAAKDYVSSVLNGDYLNGNPYLQDVIDNTNSSVTDQVNALFAKAGQGGASSRLTGELANQLASNESNLRYQNYSDEQDRISNAITQALNLQNGDNSNMSTLLSLATGATTLPLVNASTLASGLGSLWGNSTTTTQSNSNSLLGSLLNAAASAGSAALLSSDRRLKTDIRKVRTETDGLGVYEYSYIAPPTEALADFMPEGRFIGVMADEVAAIRPWALGPEVDGYLTVDYGKL